MKTLILLILSSLAILAFATVPTSKFQKGDCIRQNDYISLPKEFGYYHLVVDKTPEVYVTCQGSYGTDSTSNEWYGCDVGPSTTFLNQKFTRVECPTWRVVDPIYRDSK